MKLLRSILPATVLAFGSAAFAADAKAPAAPAAKAEAYPLKTCIVSDEPLGSMGNAVSHTHREAGKPDRVVLFCCEGCVDDFKGDPAKFLKKLDAAAAKAKAPAAKKS